MTTPILINVNIGENRAFSFNGVEPNYDYKKLKSCKEDDPLFYNLNIPGYEPSRLYMIYKRLMRDKRKELKELV